MPLPPIDRTLTRQLLLAALVATFWVVSIVVLGWWAASEIDHESEMRQASHARAALQELLERLPKEQDSLAIWDEAVIGVRNNDGPWMAENLAEWVSAFYGHDRIYVLTPNNQPLRAVVDAGLVDSSVFEQDKAAILPIVGRLRSAMTIASEGEAESTAAIEGLGEADLVDFPGGQIGIVSVRPIIPSSNAVSQAPGEEFLHVSVEVLDSALLDSLAEKYGLAGLRVSEMAPSSTGALALVNNAGNTVAWLVWRADRPASRLIAQTAPVVLLAISFGLVCFVFLLWRLRSTSKDLQLSEAQARYLAFHDQLTSIPNRALFEDRLDRALANSRRNGLPTALHYLDLDSFKHINDTLGHHAGDELVRQVADRLSQVIREVDTVARIGGDEFAIIQVDASSEDDVRAFGERLLTVFERPFAIDSEDANVGGSVGAALQVTPETTMLELMRQADIALYEAKAEGKGRFCLFAGEMDKVVKHRRALEKDLRLALDQESGLSLAYQPIYQTGSSKILGAEALARWEHPVYGPLPPDVFVGLAEERGLIEKLGTWALRRAAAFALEHDLAWIAVNVSPIQFRDEHLPTKVMATLAETGLDASKLQLEITEGVLLQNSKVVRENIRQLRAAGIIVALDDFGTGYSSITYLRTYGVDKLKIDRSFVSQLGEDDEIDSIVQAIIDLAKAMRMTVTAEGVETPDQLNILAEMGCAEVQGYYLSRPVPAASLGVLLKDSQRKKTA